MTDEFKIIENANGININFGTECLYFKNKNKIVTDSGKIPSANYLGHCYRLVSRFEKDFSFFNRSGKALLGIILVICTLSFALFSKPIRKLFTKKHYSINYGIQIPSSSPTFPINNNPIKKSTQNQNQTDSQSQDKTKSDFTNLLPDELNLEIFSYLASDDLVSCSDVNRKWRNLASSKELLKNTSGTVYDKEAWKCVGDIGDEPVLPLNMHKILKSGWIAAIIPSTINGFPYTLNSLGVLAMSPKSGNATKFEERVTTNKNVKSIWNQSVPKPYWILMPKEPLSLNQPISHMPQIVDKLAEKTKMAFKIPSTLEAATVLSLHYIIKGEYLFPNVMFRCKDDLTEKLSFYDSIPLGMYSQNGLNIGTQYFPQGQCISLVAKIIPVAVREL